jgi:hypothetical protein
MSADPSPAAPGRPAAPIQRPTGFGFGAIMARPDFTRFRRWYDAMNVLPRLPGARTQEIRYHDLAA